MLVSSLASALEPLSAFNLKGTACLWKMLMGRLEAVETRVSVCIFHTLGMSPLLSQVSEKKKKKLHQGNDTLGEISNGK